MKIEEYFYRFLSTELFPIHFTAFYFSKDFFDRVLKRSLLGKYTNTDDVGDDSTKSQNRHSNAFHPKSATLDGAIFIHIKVATMTCVQVGIRRQSCRSTFIEAFKVLKFFHSFQMPFGLRMEED